MVKTGSRTGRGRLSSIDQLPEAADEIVLDIAEQLRKREREQQDILAEFNDRLAEIDLGPISKSAFNRYSMRMAEISRRLDNTREITRVLTDKLQPGQQDDLTVMTAEMIKMLVFELLNEAGDAGISPKGAMEMASAIKNAAAAQRISSDRRAKLESEIAAKVDQAVEQVAEKLEREGGLSADLVAQMRRDFLGVKQAVKEEVANG